MVTAAIRTEFTGALAGMALAFGLIAFAWARPAYEVQTLLVGSSPSASRSTAWKPGDGLVLEVGGMDFLPDGRLAVAIRKGEVWIFDGLGDPSLKSLKTNRFASGLHEPLGLLYESDSLLVTQRTEVTRLRDTNHDGVADEYLTAGRGWNVSGAYHGYAYGPKRDGQGKLWVALNVDMGDRSDNKAAWRGWAGTIGPNGEFQPVAAGMRSPCGLGANTAGDMFCVDQQGTWVPATPIYHLRRGAFYLNPEGIASQARPESPVTLSAPVPNKVPYPEAVRALPEMTPPAVWLPYNKMGRSGTDLAVCAQAGKFGPFDGQFFVGEFTDAKVSRVFLERVDGQYQGAAFPFVAGLAAGVVRVLFGPDGNLYAGLTNRGWSSLGTHAYGLQRIRWNGSTPFEIRAMRAQADGFELEFTSEVEPTAAGRPDAYGLKSYTYFYSNAYGSAEIDPRELTVARAEVSADRRRVRLRVDGLRPLYVHELHAAGVRSAAGETLAHPEAYYTLNRVPR
jgi:glucose/arabinose dehydrogenase